MHSGDAATQIISKAIADVNAQRTSGPPLVDSPDTRLLGEEGVIDSLSFAFLVVTIEQHALDDIGKEIILFDDEVMTIAVDDASNPFATIGSLTQYVQKKIS